MMCVAAIALGSNLTSQWGAPNAALHEALKRLGALGRIEAVSSFYETAPVGYTDQPNFVNAAMLLQTELDPPELMAALLAIERAMGRNRSTAPATGPRIIDLDLLLMGDAILNTPELTLPHPAMANRRFVLKPLDEIAPTLTDPRTGLTIAEMLANLPA